MSQPANMNPTSGPFRSSDGVPLTRDTASRTMKLAYGTVLTVLAVVCGYLATLYGALPGVGAFIFGVSGISVIVAAFGFTGTGPCPSCGKPIVDVPRDMPGVPCSGCGAYAIVREARMYPTPDDHVASMTTYGYAVESGAQPPFPPFCVGCGVASTQTVAWELSRTVIGAPGVGRIVKKWSIQVPMCPIHATPGSLGLPTGITSSGGTIQIRSYRVWLALTGRKPIDG